MRTIDFPNLSVNVAKRLQLHLSLKIKASHLAQMLGANVIHASGGKETLEALLFTVRKVSLKCQSLGIDTADGLLVRRLSCLQRRHRLGGRIGIRALRWRHRGIGRPCALRPDAGHRQGKGQCQPWENGVIQHLSDYPLSTPKQPSSQLLREIADGLEPALHRAGQAILAIYHQPDHAIQTKQDASPVTEADIASHHVLIQEISRITPDWPIVSEEDSETHTGGAETHADRIALAVRKGDPFWLLDPLDGTKEFIARTGEFSINVGLVIGGDAALGLLYGPLQGLLYRGGQGVPAQRKTRDDDTWQNIHCRKRPADGGTLISSRRSVSSPSGDVFARREHLGSALKFGRIAEGSADCYLRGGTTMEWDTCAGHAIVQAAGGQVRTLDQEQLRYGKPEFRNPGFLVTGIY